MYTTIKYCQAQGQGQSQSQKSNVKTRPWGRVCNGLLAMAIIAVVVFIERGQRRIIVNYAQRQQGRKLMQAQSSHLPFKVNMAGVIPAIFASTFLLFPASLSEWFGKNESLSFFNVFWILIAFPLLLFA